MYKRQVEDEESPIEILKIDASAEVLQRQRMQQMRAARDETLVAARLAELTQAAKDEVNVIPAMLDCARVYCTLYEIRHALETVWGAYREPVFF